MTKTQIVRQLLQQSPFLAFSKDDLRKIDQRYHSGRNVYVRFGYQWKDEHGHDRKTVSIALKRALKGLFEHVRKSFSDSKHQLNYASLRAQAGTPVLHKIVLDILSADLLLFDMTYVNPNVSFELGIAYAANRNLFLLLREGASRPLPSDLAGLTYCTYKIEKGFSMGSFAEKDVKSVMRKIVAQKIRLSSPR